mmetsp:Transcript_520/g.1286  ORF Transcript_520/g.1286 Transcript_520/m.1286 type:complete len:231 (-) Transcript_520:1002-1694(-)
MVATEKLLQYPLTSSNVMPSVSSRQEVNSTAWPAKGVAWPRVKNWRASSTTSVALASWASCSENALFHFSLAIWSSDGVKPWATARVHSSSRASSARAMEVESSLQMALMVVQFRSGTTGRHAIPAPRKGPALSPSHWREMAPSRWSTSVVKSRLITSERRWERVFATDSFSKNSRDTEVWVSSASSSTSTRSFGWRGSSTIGSGAPSADPFVMHPNVERIASSTCSCSS